MKKLENLKLSNTFAKLGADFLQEKSPDPVSNPYLIDSNAGLEGAYLYGG